MPVPEYNADPKAVPFLRWVREQVEALQTDVGRRATGEENTNRGQSATLQVLGQNIVSLAANVAAAFTALTVRADQVTSGTIDLARLPTIPQTQVSGTWDKSVSTSGSGNFAAGLTSTGVAATNVTLLPGTRSIVYVSDSFGVIGQTTSSIVYKTNLAPVPYTASQFLAVMPLVFEYIGQVDIRNNPENPYYDPDYIVPLEIGLVAEHLIAAGMPLYVLFEADGETPMNIDYATFGAHAALIIGADHESRLRALEAAQGSNA